MGSNENRSEVSRFAEAYLELEKTYFLQDYNSQEQQEEIERMIAEIAAKDTHIRNIEAQLSSTEAQLSSTEAQISDLVNSKSWKITAPLRWLTEMFRRR